MFSRTRNKRKKGNSYTTFIILIILLFLLVLLYFLSMFVFQKYKIKNSLEKTTLLENELNNSSNFSIEKVLLYSSANATSNDTSRNLWNLNIYQYTDIIIYINNNSENLLSNENTIKKLSIDNIQYVKPEKGSPCLYYKSIENIGLPILDDKNLIEESLDFNIVKSKDSLDTNLANFYETCQTPITLQFVNKDIKNNAIIPNSGEPLTFDGTLLSRTNIPINNIKTHISFNINVENNNNEKFVYNISIDIPLEDDNNTIYNGNFYKEITIFQNNKFLKLQN